MKAKDEALSHLRREITEIEPASAWELLRGGVALIDVRDAEEWAQGTPPGAIRIGRGRLEMQIEDTAPDLSAPLRTGPSTCVIRRGPRLIACSRPAKA